MRCHNQELKLLFFTKKYWNILLMTIANINLSFLYYFGIFYWLNLCLYFYIARFFKLINAHYCVLMADLGCLALSRSSHEQTEHHLY